MDNLFVKLADLQEIHASAIAEYGEKAQATFNRFYTDFVSPEKLWSIPWLNAFGDYVADNPQRHSDEELAQYLGAGLVRCHGGVWGVMDEDGEYFGVFDRDGRILHSLRATVEHVKLGMLRGSLGFAWLHSFLGDLAGPTIEGTDITVGQYRDLWFHESLRVALDHPNFRQEAVLSTAKEEIRAKVASAPADLHERAVKLGLESITDALNDSLVENGRNPLK